MAAPDPNGVDDYIEQVLIDPDPGLAALRAAGEAGLPEIAVSPAQGKLLHLLARIKGARTILELGTLGGYSTIWLARALPAGGRLVTLEAEPRYAEVAKANLQRAGLDAVTEIVVGPALETLPTLKGPFDLIFIDADKQTYPRYLEWALRLSQPGSVIVGDNVVRGGALIDPQQGDDRGDGARRFHELMAADPRVDATTIQTVGRKGWDGFALAVVGPAP
jgi:predicted O-methyltransferase YrrM